MIVIALPHTCSPGVRTGRRHRTAGVLRLAVAGILILLRVNETAFRGWGLTGRIEDRRGLEIAPWNGGKM